MTVAVSATAAAARLVTRLTPNSRTLVSRLRAQSIDRLASMYAPDSRRFVFRLRREGGRLVPEGQSLRYTAIVLLGLQGEPEDVQQRVLQGDSLAEVCDEAVRTSAGVTSIGDVSLVCWSAAALGSALLPQAFERLRALQPATAPVMTVDLSWALLAACECERPDAAPLRDALAARLIQLYRPEAKGFPHQCGIDAARSHVSCFADQVYPILALSRYGSQTGNARALTIATATAANICDRQGPGGQWWWHYHVQSGAVVEPYPVYSVHQHAMAPMALSALDAASGLDHSTAVDRGLDWLGASPELGGGTLVDDAAGVIWRKVARREPRKLSRYLQAAAAWVHTGARVPGLDVLFPPGAVDYECRPYELGWLLFAFPHGSLGAQP